MILSVVCKTGCSKATFGLHHSALLKFLGWDVTYLLLFIKRGDGYSSREPFPVLDEACTIH